MPESIEYVHTSIYEVSGVTVGEDDPLVLASTPSTWACLTTDPDSHCTEIDEDRAIATMLLRVFTGGRPEGSFCERFAVETDRIRERRESEQPRGTYLVFRRHGEIDDWEPARTFEVDDFVVRLGEHPSGEIREQTRERLVTFVFALSLIHTRQLRLKAFRDVVVYHLNDGRRLFPKYLTASASAAVSTSFPEEKRLDVEETYQLLNSVPSLARVLELFTASLESSDNPLRAFLMGWTALEMFVNKIFSTYEQMLTSGDRQAIAEKIDGRGLAYRFFVMAYQLSRESADSSLKTFREVMNARHDLVHRGVVTNAQSIEDIRELMKRYLILHVQKYGYT